MPATAAPPESRHRSLYAQAPAQRLEEVAAILALGFVRLHAKENASNPRDFGDFSLDFAGQASVHGPSIAPGENGP